MFQAVFRHSDVLSLPIVALVLFALAFLALSVRALHEHEENTRVSALPLDSDDGPRSPSQAGASHER